MGDEQQRQAPQREQANAGNQVLSNEEREAARHVQQSGEQAARAAAPQREQAPGQGRADPARVQAVAAEVHAELNREGGATPPGAAAGMTPPPEMVDQLRSLSRQAVAFLIQQALQKLGLA